MKPRANGYVFDYITSSGNSLLKNIKKLGNSGGELLIYNFTYNDAGISTIESLSLGNWAISYELNEDIGRKIVANITSDNGFGDINLIEYTCDDSAYITEWETKMCVNTTTNYPQSGGYVKEERYSEIGNIRFKNCFYRSGFKVSYKYGTEV